MSNLDATRGVGELVVEVPARARALDQLGVDYCCNGTASLEEACRNAGVTLAQVEEALGAPGADAPVEAVNPAELTLTELADHIVETHHAFLRQELPRLSALVEKVSQVHGDTESWTVEANRLFRDLVAEVETHMMKEEQILFPMVRQLELAQSAPEFHCGSIGNPIAAMEHEHDYVGQALRQLRELSSNFQAPEGACQTFTGMLAGLQQLELDLHQHIHKENNILFVRATEAEGRLQEAA